MGAVATSPVKNRTPLLEQVMFVKPLRVDRAAGIIYECKVLGRVSRNGWEYTDQALDRAVRERIFESAKVYIGHPPRSEPYKERSKDEAFGRLFNVRRRPDGIYADLKFLPGHKDARDICDDAESGMGMFGLSPNQDGDKRPGPGGRTFIYEIYAPVRSVDLVTRPATCTALSESESERPRMKTTVKQLLESLSCQANVPTRTRRLLLEEMETPLYEAPELAGEMDAPAEDADPMATLSAGYKSACDPLLAAALAGDDEAWKKLDQFIKSHRKVTGAKGDKPADGGKGEGGGKDATESHRIQGENDAYKLLMEARIDNPPAILIESLAALPTEEKRRQLLNEYRVERQNNSPRSQGPAGQRAAATGAGNGQGKNGQANDGKPGPWVTK